MCKVKSNQPDARYINPMTDFGFKKVFGDPDVMKAFLMDLLKPESPIVKITFLDKEMVPENALERGVIYDMRCKTEDGNEFIVEMQNKGQIHFADRILYYLSRSIAPQGEKGLIEVVKEDGTKRYTNWDFELQPVYGIFFLNFHLGGLERQPLRTVEFLVRETGEVFSDKMRAYTIELPCYDKTEDECTEDLDYWAYILNHMDTIQTQLPFVNKKPIFQRISDIAEIAKMPIKEREEYRQSLDAFRTNVATYAYEHAMGHKEGHAEGLAEGLEKGREEGREEGRDEKAFDVARRMLVKGFGVSDISEMTGLDASAIADLQSN